MLLATPETLPATGLLAAQALSCKRGRRVLFRGLGLQLDPGTVTWLRGSNGSGKSSLIRILAGLSPAAEGTVTWNGAPLQRAGSAARARLLYIGHANALKDDLTLREALAFHARLAGLDAAGQRAGAALERLGLGAALGTPVRNLSQGQRRRGALARLLLDDTPRTWLLDEPYESLDAESARLLSALIDDHSRRGGAALLASHQPLALSALRPFDLEPLRVQ